MSPELKRLFYILGLVVIFGVVTLTTTSAAWIFWDSWKNSDVEAYRALLGGFVGAFFAYIFVRLGDALNKIYDRKAKNHTSLVRLQHYFNDCLNTTSDNIFIADDCIRIFSESNLNSGSPVFMNVFHEYPIDNELIVTLTNIDLINELASIRASIIKMNSSLASIDRAYSQIRSAFISQNMPRADYIHNARSTRLRCVEIKPFLEQISEELIRLYAVINILLKRPPFLIWVNGYLTRTSYPKDMTKELLTELPMVQKGIEDNASKSKERIARAKAEAEAVIK